MGVQGTGEISFPLDLATDFMVWNITKDVIRTTGGNSGGTDMRGSPRRINPAKANA